MSEETKIDWSKFTGPIVTTCFCRCGHQYRSHCKTVKIDEQWGLVTKNPCSKCGKNNNCYRASTDPETFTIER